MVSASQFYKTLGEAGYNSLITNNVMPNDDAIIRRDFTMLDKQGNKLLNIYGAGFEKTNDTAYGKRIELMLIEHLRGNTIPERNNNDILRYLPHINIEELVKICMNEFNSTERAALMTPNEQKNQFDLIYGSMLIDVKTYKVAKFTKATTRSFMVQMALYYTQLPKDVKETITNIAIYNPVHNTFLYVPVHTIDGTTLLELYHKANTLVSSFFGETSSLDLSKTMRIDDLIEGESDSSGSSFFEFLGWTKSARESKLNKKNTKNEKEIKRLKKTIKDLHGKIDKYKKILSSIYHQIAPDKLP